jgi:hypothetical protein
MNEEQKKMRSSRGNAPLRMTEMDSRRMKSCTVYRIDPHAAFAAPSEDENTDSRIYVSRYPKEDEK